MSAQEDSPRSVSPDFFAVLRPVRGWHSQYLESDGFLRAKDAIRAMNRQYAVTAMIDIILATASYHIPDSPKNGSSDTFEPPTPTRLEDGRLFYAAAAIVYRGLPVRKKDRPFDDMDYRLFTTFNSGISPHNALHLLDAANEQDIEYMENRLRTHRIARFHGNPPLLSESDEFNLELDLAGREQKRINIRARAKSLGNKRKKNNP